MAWFYYLFVLLACWQRHSPMFQTI